MRQPSRQLIQPSSHFVSSLFYLSVSQSVS